MQIRNGNTSQINSAEIATPSMFDVDLKIAHARRAQSEAIKRLVVGSISAIDRRLLHRS